MFLLNPLFESCAWRTGFRELRPDEKLINVVLRKDQLIPYPPPGSLEIVTDRII